MPLLMGLDIGPPDRHTGCPYSVLEVTEMTPTDPADWIRRCADRLYEQWPRADREILEDTAMDLLGSEKWRRLNPEVAAVAWLRQGVLVPQIEGIEPETVR
jgi:hypothetical protein